MFLSFVFSLVQHLILSNDLSKKTYNCDLQISSSKDLEVTLYYDFNLGFNENSKISASIKKGRNSISLPIENKDEKVLSHLRLDFDSSNDFDDFRIHKIQLINNQNTLFSFDSNQLLEKIFYGNQITMNKDISGDALFLATKNFSDAHLIFAPLNELVYPKWQRVLLLVLPWLLFFLVPVTKWIIASIEKKEIALIFIAFFICAIPLKIAWVTFTSLLLFAYALYEFYKKKDFNFGVNHFFLCLYIIVPILFLGQGDFSKIIMPLGLLLWVFSGSILRNSIDENKIKLIYISVFTIVMGITLVSWASLLFFEGYFYGVNTENYFYLVKWKFHHVLYWLYFDHPNFLSFFVTIGAVFCLDLYRKNSIPKSFGVLYAIFAISFALILGSRFALLLLLCSPLLYLIPIKSLSRYIFIGWAVLSSLALWFIKYLDAQREQIWSLSIAAIKEKPWFGYGTGSSSTILPASINVNQNDIVGVLEINHSHNQIVSYALENGVLGALIIVVGLALIIYHFGKQRNRLMLIVTFMLMLLMIIEAPFRTTTPLYAIGFLYAIFGNETILKTKSN